LDTGKARVAEIDDKGNVVVNEWLKQAILIFFKCSAMQTTELRPFEYADKVPLKEAYEEAGVRVVPGASARWGSFLDRGVVMMPSYVNIGARVGANTMVDTWATVGSCAQIGANVHLSGGVGIGGVLAPPQAAPVIVEDDAMIGSRCMVVEGARVGENRVARTGGSGPRLLLAGHTDTVPPNGNDRARVDGDVLWGLGSADMKSGVAVLVELARTVERPVVPVTYVFYECEEVAA